MGAPFYKPQPIPPRPAQPNRVGARAASAHTPMNGSKPHARETIARILADERFRASARTVAPLTLHAEEQTAPQAMRQHPAQTTQRHRTQAEPIPKTQRIPKAPDLFSLAPQPAAELPERYRQMRAISRWQDGPQGTRGRWLTEAELFYRQGLFMADFEDSCPYHGIFKSYFPTYNAMSDRQLRGYFTWRANVRRGLVEETSLSFAYVYLYELINGIGVENPLDGFRKLESFWQAYRAFAPEIDRFASVWLQDYVVYHGLSPELIKDRKTMAFDRALIELRESIKSVERFRVDRTVGHGTRKRTRAKTSALPLPANTELEERLLSALDALSTYRIKESRLYKTSPEALRHVACAVFVRMNDYHAKQRTGSLMESWFGEEVVLPYTMFGSAVFFASTPHADCTYELDEIHRYRCENGYWTCERVHGSRSRSPKLGNVLRATDRMLRDALGFEHPLKETGKTPKYLQKFITHEIETWQAWCAWNAAHAPVRVEIDLSQLAEIRTAAAATRESLLIDEERAGTGALLDAAASDELDRPAEHVENEAGQQQTASHTNEPVELQPAQETPAPRSDTLLSPPQADYLRALLSGDTAAREQALSAVGLSEDMLIDAINEALFDLVGDTVVEYGADGPALIEDYRSDVEGILNHE